MRKFKEREKVFEGANFEEFVDFGKKEESAKVVEGVLQSFNYKGFNVMRGGEDKFLIPTRRGTLVVLPSSVVVTTKEGSIEVLDKDVFASLFVEIKSEVVPSQSTAQPSKTK